VTGNRDLLADARTPCLAARAWNRGIDSGRAAAASRVVKLALGGDAMLGRGVAERLETEPADSLFAPELVDLVREADLFVLNLECCLSARGEPTPGRVFHFRAPPWAAQALAHLGVDCVTLANNHALDFGPDALLDTLSHLDAAGIRAVGAGTDLERARAPAVLEAGGFRLAVLGFADHPAEYAADADRPGIAYADLQDALPDWLTTFPDADAVLVTPHWGPNMTAEPQGDVRRAAHALVGAGATLVAGHSAHVFHGVAPRVLYDLGDFLDDYRVDPKLRNDLGLLFLVDLAGDRLEAIPLKLEFAQTRLAAGQDAAWITRRFVDACARLGTEVSEHEGRLVARWR
jgi:poly-gamma-glutamate capsule biosynthesis protein CapA/YwtB (metallophosphatase superfamily)